MRNFYTILYCSLALVLSSCSRDTLVNEYKEIARDGWNWSQPVEFPFAIEDTRIQYNFFLNLRISGNYKFSNIYVLVHLKDPDGKITTQRIPYTLADDEGNWLGKGLGDIVTFEMPMFTKSFSKPGNYSIRIEQNMRDEKLQGVMEAGLRVNRGNPVF